MEWPASLRSHIVALPNLAKFAIVMAIIACAPALARRLRVPELVGLLGFGVLPVADVSRRLDMRRYHLARRGFGEIGSGAFSYAAWLLVRVGDAATWKSKVAEPLILLPQTPPSREYAERLERVGALLI
jgi:hypothetical protein